MIAGNLAEHWRDSAHCQRCLDVYEDPVPWPCEPVRTVLTLLGLAAEDVARLAEHYGRRLRTDETAMTGPPDQVATGEGGHR